MLGQRQLHRITVRLFDKIATKIVAKLYNESFASCGHTAATTLMSRNHAAGRQSVTDSTVQRQVWGSRVEQLLKTWRM